MNTQEQIKYIESMEKFIQHNLNNKYIKPETTIEEFLQFINDVKENYIPMIEQIKNAFNGKENCQHKNKTLIRQSDFFRVQDGAIMVFKCYDCGKVLTHHYCEP